jgi:hypothetical protein
MMKKKSDIGPTLILVFVVVGLDLVAAPSFIHFCYKENLLIRKICSAVLVVYPGWFLVVFLGLAEGIEMGAND